MYDDLKDCGFRWALDLFGRSRNYKTGVKEIVVNRERLKSLAVWAHKMEGCCDFRDVKSNPVSAKMLYDAILYGLRKSGKTYQSSLAEEVWSRREGNEVFAKGETDLADLFGMLVIESK